MLSGARRVAMLLAVMLLTMTAQTAWGQGVDYRDADGTLKNTATDGIDGNDSPTVLTGNEADSYDNVNLNGWYVVTEDVDYYNNNISINGDVHLILADGKTMTVVNENSAITLTNGSLTIYGQAHGTGTLNATGNNKYGINGNYKDLTVNGGIVNATGTNGIKVKNFTVNGGIVTANATGGTGINTNNGAINLKGGTVTAIGSGSPGLKAENGTITLSGGTVKANSYLPTVNLTCNYRNADGATIGSDDIARGAYDGVTIYPAVNVNYLDENGETRNVASEDYKILEGKPNGGTTTLAAGTYVVTSNITYNGTVNLNGDVTLILKDGCTMNVGTSGVPIIGMGINSTIKNLTITSQSLGDGMGALSIYTRDDNHYGITVRALTINGGNITVDAKGANSTALYAAFGDVTINGGTFSAKTTGSNADAIYANGNFYYNGGNVTVDAPRSFAIRAEGGHYTFNWRSPADRITIGTTGTPGLYPPDGATATFSKLFTDGTTVYSTSLTVYGGDELDVFAGKTLRPYGYSLTANEADGNRWTTFYSSQTGFSIKTADAYAYTAEYDADNSQLTLTKLGTDIPAGTAVVIASATSPVTLAIKGTLGSFDGDNDLRGEDVRTSLADIKTKRGDGTFYVMSKKGTDFGFFKYTDDYMPANKAYLLLSGGGTPLAPGLKMVFGDGETNSLSPILSPSREGGAGAWYTLDGRKLDKQPTQKGLYIHGNIKVVIK